MLLDVAGKDRAIEMKPDSQLTTATSDDASAAVSSPKRFAER